MVLDAPPTPVTTVVTFTHTGQVGTGGGTDAALDPGAAPAKLAPPAEALSSDTAPVIDNGPASVGGLSHGSVAS